MKTKIVYVVIANQDSIYLEQAYVSVWSLKYYNPDALVTFVMDDRTKTYWDVCGYDELKTLVDDIIVQKFDDNATNHYRSRWLKTSLRMLVKGDYLFLDTDTIIADNISEIDNLDIENIGAVCDWHKNRAMFPLSPLIINNTKFFYGINNIPTDINYYNSGVLLVKENDLTNRFYEKWHSLWIKSQKHPYGKYDQPSLFVTDIIFNGVISPVPDTYNYQLLATIRFLYSSKIIHFYNAQQENVEIHKFFSMDPFHKIKRDRIIANDIQNLIINCKSEFNFETLILGPNQLKLWNSYIFRIYRKLGEKLLFRKLESVLQYLHYSKYKRICLKYKFKSE